MGLIRIRIANHVFGEWVDVSQEFVCQSVFITVLPDSRLVNWR